MNNTHTCRFYVDNSQSKWPHFHKLLSSDNRTCFPGRPDITFCDGFPRTINITWNNSERTAANVLNKKIYVIYKKSFKQNFSSGAKLDILLGFFGSVDCMLDICELLNGWMDLKTIFHRCVNFFMCTAELNTEKMNVLITLWTVEIIKNKNRDGHFSVSAFSSFDIWS